MDPKASALYPAALCAASATPVQGPTPGPASKRPVTVMRGFLQTWVRHGGVEELRRVTTQFCKAHAGLAIRSALRLESRFGRQHGLVSFKTTSRSSLAVHQLLTNLKPKSGNYIFHHHHKRAPQASTLPTRIQRIQISNPAQSPLPAGGWLEIRCCPSRG